MKRKSIYTSIIFARLLVFKLSLKLFEIELSDKLIYRKANQTAGISKTKNNLLETYYLIAALVYGVIPVVHSGKSSRQIVRRSRQLLLDIGAKVFGIVFNNVILRSQDNSYYYQSYYHRDNYRQDNE